MVTTAESPAAASHYSPSSLLRSTFVDTSYDSGNTEAASTTNTRNLFKGPGFVKHIYVLTQQDEFETSLTVPTLANWNEADVTFYDTSTTTYADLGLPIYKQVIPMGIPDGFLQEIVDDIRQKYNTFILWIDSNLIGEFDGNATAAQNCAGFGDANYTGTLLQECGNTSTNLANCRKLNKMICSFNWGLDYLADKIAGRFHAASTDTATNCAGSTVAADVVCDDEDDFRGKTLIANCGTGLSGSGNHRANCTKLNKLICYLNHAMVELDDAIIGQSAGCSAESVSIGAWRGFSRDDMCGDGSSGSGLGGESCTKINYLRCSLMSLVSKIGFDSSGIALFSWYVISSPIAALIAYNTWTVPLKNYIPQDWAPKKDFIDLGASAGGLAPQFDFDNYNRNQGFQITFPEPGLYVTNGLTVRQNTDQGEPSGTQAPAHINVIYQQASTSVDAKTGGILNA